MPKHQIHALITDLHERFADDLVSPEQQALLQQLQLHIHEMGEADPVDTNFVDTVDLLLAETETEHPVVAGMLRQVLELLRNMGI
jgi:hypothetical protein